MLCCGLTMRIRMICPAPPGSFYGNRITAVRWAEILRQLGSEIAVAADYRGEPCDLLVALHAWRSAPAVLRFRRFHPNRPAIVALTGTDVYRDIHRFRRARRALEAADRLVALQPLAALELPEGERAKVRVIYQSVEPTRAPVVSRKDDFIVTVVGHLRRVKDPLRAAYASRGLDASSRIRVVQYGAAIEPRFAAAARAEERRNARYQWRGEVGRTRLRRLLAGSQLMVLSSRMEGGANVISEAVVDRVPVLASKIPGSIGLLGDDYPGYFPAGDTVALRELMRRAETDGAFYRDLKSRCARRARLFLPAREKAAWRALLGELSGYPNG